MDFLSNAISPAALINPPSSRSLRVSFSALPARFLASSMIVRTAAFEKWEILPSFLTSWAINCASFTWFSGESGMSASMKTS